jgi:drug/metabolite transporter (DMT)-like permease
MPLTVMVVVLLAALLHASWNFLVKRTEDKHLSMSAVVMGHTPFAAAVLLWAPFPDPGSFPYVIAGAVLHTGYQLFLLYAYRIGDLSQVYPLARGVAPLIVACVSVLFLGVRLSPLQGAAVAAIAAGIMSLTLVRRSDGMRNRRAAAMAIVTGGFIASYSLVDGLGAREAGTALGFYGSLSILNAILFAAVMRIVRPGILKKLAVQNHRLALSGGGASFTAYALVVWSFTLAPIALVTALRETSIIFALMLGVFVLKERLDIVKLGATVLTLLGVGMLRLGG